MAGLDVKISQLGEVVVASDNDLLNLVTYDEQNQTYVSGKVKSSTMKDYMIGDTDISNLGDGTPTGAIDALDDKIDDNYDEWKEQWQKNGAYNLACGVFTSKVENGTTYIANSDGSVSVSGEATGSNITSSAFTLKAGTYLVGFNPIPQSGGVTTDSTNFTILDSSNNHLTGLPLNDATSKVITVAADTVVKIRLYVYANSSGHTTNTTFYPIITTDLNATVADFVSPAKTNRQLTEDVTPTRVKHETLDNTNFFGTVDVYEVGKIVYVMGDIQIKSNITYNTVIISNVPEAIFSACGVGVGGDGSIRGRIGVSGTNLIASSNLTTGYTHIAMSYLAK